MFVRFFLVCCCCFPACCALAQQPPADWEKQADALYDKEQYEKAAGLLLVWEKVFEQQAKWHEYSACAIMIADVYDELANDSIPVAHVQAARETLARNQQDRTLDYAKLQFWTGYYLVHLDRVNDALVELEEACRRFEALHFAGEELVKGYKNAASIYMRRLDYDNADRCFDLAEKADTTGFFTDAICLNRGYSLFHRERYDEAIAQFRKGLRATSDPYYIALLELGLSDVFWATEHFAESESKARSAVRYLEKSNDDPESLAQAYTNLAVLSEHFGRYAAADSYYAKALRMINLAYEGKGREKAKIWVKTAEYRERCGQLTAALEAYQQAIIQVFSTFNSTDWHDNPTPDAAYVESFGMSAPAKKGMLLLKMAATAPPERRMEYRECAAAAFDLAFADIHQLKNSYDDEESKLYLGGYTHRYLENALETRRLLYEQSGQQQHFERFFQLMEENKAGILAEALRKNKILNGLGIPDSLLIRETNLRFELARAQAALYDPGLSAAEKSAAQNRFTRLESGYRELFRNIGQQYPAYQQFIVQNQSVSIELALQRLAPGEALLEYFEGEAAVYVLCISREGHSIRRVEKTPALMADLQRLLQFFSTPEPLLNDPSGYTALAYAIAQRLWALPPGVDKVLLVPDGIISFIPFDALTTDANWNGDFARTAFLLRKYRIAYSWSAALWLHPQEQTRATINLHFAPLFAGGERGLAPLRFSQDDVGDSFFDVFSGQKAESGALMQAIQQPLGVLHLSTHANTTGIELYDRALTLPELYALRLRADLVVLSACETGLGTIERGEGVMSLARSFAYAGAGSLISSLWQINDRSTAAFFQEFYKAYFDGASRLDALRQAKLARLDAGGSVRERSPYYWAAFSFYGQDGHAPHSYSPWTVLLWLAGILLALFALRKTGRMINVQ